MFKKILIANRGEIAVRIARTARKLGIRSVAVYSEADKQALHVEVCDEAFCIGAAAVSESYLNAETILQVARQSGAEAIHPGYGFMSENAVFARACEAAGIVFIGPPASAIDAMGSKSEAKSLMHSAGVALVPGYHGDDQTDEKLAAESIAVGYPQLIKASAGGGGKGMRLVENKAEFSEALISARREARSSFGDDQVLIERYLTRPRHVEMQIFADSFGDCVHLFERDCSIQRRHQKILEEAPAPGVSDELRLQMGEAAINCATAINYSGAGTVEFLLDEDGCFYFMEMNTRLQVEHPVSEMISGQDLVEWQFRVANGEPLPLQQSQISKTGHAFEARIYAESPQRDFMPAAGRIEYLRLPEAVDGVRIDTGVRNGDLIGIHYDPMIAKLIVHAADRATALAKLRLALADFQILGLSTNIGFLTRLLEMPELIAADFDTGFIGSHHARLFAPNDARQRRATLMAAAALLAAFDTRNQELESPWQLQTHWRMNLPKRQLIELEYDGLLIPIEVIADRDGWQFAIDGNSCRLEGAWAGPFLMRIDIDGERIEYPVVESQNTVSLCYQGQTFEFGIPGRLEEAANSAINADQPRAPMSGAVVALSVAVGDTVEPGATLMVIEAMKMEHAIVAQMRATVGEILFSVGDQVEEGDSLVILEVEKQ